MGLITSEHGDGLCSGECGVMSIGSPQRSTQRPQQNKNKNRIKVGTKTKLHDYEWPYYALKQRTRILDKRVNP